MTFVIPNLEATHARLVRSFQNRFPNANVSRGSDNWIWLRIYAEGLMQTHRHLQIIDDDIMPDTATGPRLDRWAFIVGETRKAATPASKAAALRCVGTPGSTVTVGDLLTHADGTTYQINSTLTVGVGATYVDADVLAISTGSATRKSAGETLTFSSTPAGFQSVASLQLDMDVGGVDTEEDGALRVRVLDRIAQPGMGGNSHDYRTWAEEVSGVAAAFVYPTRAGLGSVHVVPLRSGRGALRLITGADLAAVQAQLDLERPVSVKDIAAVAASILATDTEMLVTPTNEPAYQFDWDDTVALSVTSWDTPTRTLQFTTARPADMRVGDRVIYKRTAATKNDGAEMVIESFTSTDKVIITAKSMPAVGSEPQAGNAVYSGGPLVEPLRQLILALYDSLGPARGTSADPNDPWDDTLRVASLLAIGQKQRGVMQTTISAPGANVVGANSVAVNVVELVTPRQTLVRRG